MKRPGLLLPLCAATLFLGLPRLALAANQPAAPMLRSPQRQQELLARFDRNHDGKLDDDERADAKEAMLKEQLDRQTTRTQALPGGAETFRALALALFDRDGDGRLDENERATAEKFGEKYRGSPGLNLETIKRFDRDANGRFDDDELAALETHLQTLPRRPGLASAPGNPEMRRELLQRFDRDGNGRIDADELGALEAALRPRIAQTPAQLRRFDRNQDGKLDDAEWERARTVLLAWLNASAPANAPAPGQAPTTAKASASAEPRDEPNAAEATRWATGYPTATASPDEMSAEERRAADDARLKAVADEISRRRAETANRVPGK